MMLTARSKRSPVLDMAATNVNDGGHDNQSANRSANRARSTGILTTSDSPSALFVIIMRHRYSYLFLKEQNK
jgi:hypothetical protein